VPLPAGPLDIDIDHVTFSYRSRADRALPTTSRC
jgi:hypothetical protein